MSKRDIFWLIVKQILVVGVVVTLIRGFILIPVQVTGSSMRNLLKPGDSVVMEKFSKINRFDIIVFTRADGSTLVKRVVGLPGEKVVVKNDKLYINDKKIAENFLTDEKAKDKSKLPFTSNFTLEELTDQKKLGKNEYFVMGDNRRASKDSRAFGPIKRTEILGKARFVYWPMTDFKWLG